ncbi:hypothetical protein HaLaN_11292 [Haematococcus lacustris]|uniref:Uncharacterized protein n=1 Tax=Haematococcus lacustris TaxID=44745 RepID=A0A699Z8F3_HAELA|nr:hypothetical protein HaLaN_11292 [Haematococcus lacustris]
MQGVQAVAAAEALGRGAVECWGQGSCGTSVGCSDHTRSH